MKINGRRITQDMRFADDVAVVAKNERDLIDMSTNLSVAPERVQLKINANETKTINSRQT